MGDNAWVTWVALAAVLVLLELVSMDLVLLMFGIAALLATIPALFGAAVWLAIAVFVIVSVGLLFFARPAMVERLHRGPTLQTGFTNLIGTTAIVLRPVDAFGGRVHAGSEDWTARTEGDDAPIEIGTEVTIARIDGATAVVIRKA
ncbi:MAG: hypothetical protein JWP10_137 [Nocardioidaceae bacterium]|nr:hypothetical protein [Nocardioidaceae bacterium]